MRTSASFAATVGNFLMLMAVAGIFVLADGNQAVSFEEAEDAEHVPSMVQSQLLSMDAAMFAPSDENEAPKATEETTNAEEDPTEDPEEAFEEDLLQLETASDGDPESSAQSQGRALALPAFLTTSDKATRKTGGSQKKGGKSQATRTRAFKKKLHQMAKTAARAVRKEKHVGRHVKTLQMKLARSQRKIRRMREISRRTKAKERQEEKKEHALKRSGGSRIRESQRFRAYMARWWRLHRNFMKRHNMNLYLKLQQHRALSLSKLWKPFLLRWKYVQPRTLQGFRYDWKDDGTYETKRFLMKSKESTSGGCVMARIRSVNNICFPGFLPLARKRKMCTYSKPVSARAVQFALQHKPFQVVEISSLRAYSLFTPRPKVRKNRRSDVKFVSVQSAHWQIHQLIEYCDVPMSEAGVSVPIAYSPEKSSPKREYSLKYMEWKPIKMMRELKSNGANVEKMVLQRKDGKIKISCVVPVAHPQSIYGEEVNLTTEKCTFYFKQWNFDLKCPEGKFASLALSTKVNARDDAGTGDGSPTMTPRFEGQLAFNKNKVHMQFEQQAVVHTTVNSKKGRTFAERNSVL